MTPKRLLPLALVAGLLLGACADVPAATSTVTPPITPEPVPTTPTTLMSDSSVTAGNWILAIEMGDLSTAQALLAPRSADYADSVGGIESMMSGLAEGWGAWARATDTTYTTVDTTVDGRQVTLVVITGTVSREGPPARAATVMLISDGLADPFAAVPPIGFVVPRAEFVDQLAPDIAYEVAIPTGHRCTFLLDDARLDQVETTANGRTLITPTADQSTGEHVLTAVCIGENDSVGAVAVLFETVG